MNENDILSVVGTENSSKDSTLISWSGTVPPGTSFAIETPGSLSRLFKRFKLVRAVDVTGISGTGEIALGTEWPDGQCTLYWLKYNTTGQYQAIGQLEEIHCYNDNARIVWID